MVPFMYPAWYSSYLFPTCPNLTEYRIPSLPGDVLRIIWAKVWQKDAAIRIQCAVRAAITRSQGVPWDLHGHVPL